MEENGSNKKPALLVVVGSTGVGKTKLGVYLAKQFNGEVISCDSMQIYKGVDIGTNKVTVEEADGVPHHLINIVEPTELDFNVSYFISAAKSVIRDIISRNKVPILVGGTHQYIEGILVSNPYLEQSYQATDSETKNINKNIKNSLTVAELLEIINREPINIDAIIERMKIESTEHIMQILKEVPRDQLFHLLERVDHVRAVKLHPNDYRKLIRSLYVFLTSGKLHSELTTQDHFQEYDYCLLWPSAKLHILGERLDQRIDQMVQRGLIKEVLYLRDLFKEKNIPIEFTRGVFQSIGYKEFGPFLEMTKDMTSEDILTKYGNNDETLRPVLDACLHQLKVNTRNYARKQVTWLKNRLPAVTAAIVHRFDASDVSTWDENVLRPAIDVCKAFLNHEPIEWTENVTAKADVSEEWQKFHCDSCNKTLNGPHEWHVHVTAKSHKKRLASLKRRQANENNRPKKNDNDGPV